MSSFTRFLEQAVKIAGGVKGILGGSSDGCFFILSGAGEKVQFPVNPAEFEESRSYKNSVLNINACGDINMKGKRGLKTVKFGSFFPANDYAWLNSGSMFGNLVGSTSSADPYGNIAKIEKIAESNLPAKITISGTDISMPCLIDEFTTKEQDGTGDVYFTIALSEYRSIVSESGVTNEVTGLKGRAAIVNGTRATTVTNGMSAMDSAARAVSRTTSIAKQAQRKLGVYKSIVKSGGINAGMIIKTTAASVKVGGLDIRF